VSKSKPAESRATPPSVDPHVAPVPRASPAGPLGGRDAPAAAASPAGATPAGTDTTVAPSLSAGTGSPVASGSSAGTDTTVASGSSVAPPRAALPSTLTSPLRAPGANPSPAATVPPASTDAAGAAAPYDPLRLCIYATIAALAWLLGPVAVVGFALLGFAGYTRARRRGLTRSKCFLRDTRLVLTYLAILALAGTAAIAWQLYRFFT
jgi:hypothetical protein